MRVDKENIIAILHPDLNGFFGMATSHRTWTLERRLSRPRSTKRRGTFAN